MHHRTIAMAAALLAGLSAAGMAHAEVTGTATIVSDYDYRGFSQTGEEATVQLSIDYAHDNGWYVGAWGSGIDHFSDGGSGFASTEVNLYTGFSGATDAGLGWDAGLNYYLYSGASDLNFTEIYASLSYGPFTGGVAFSDAFAHKDNDEAFYVYGDAGFPLSESLTFGVHVGYSTGDGIDQAYFAGLEDSYIDYSAGLTYAASNIELGMKWVGRDAGDAGSDDRIVLSISTSLPW